MSTPLAEVPFVAPTWVAALAPYGIASASEFASYCLIPNGRSILAQTLQVAEEEVVAVEQQLLATYGNDIARPPVEHPMGLLIDDPSPPQEPHD